MRPLIDYADDIEIQRSPEDVFDTIADLDRMFSALQRKTPIEVERLTPPGASKPGDRWRVSGDMRLGRRTGDVEITDLQRPTHIAFTTTGSGYLTKTTLTISASGPDRSRLTAHNVISANSLKARLAAPFIRLYRKRIERGLHRLLKRLKKSMER